MKNYIYPLAIAATLATTTSCNDEEVSAIQNIPDSQKAQISFSLSDETPTRHGFTGSATSLAMRMQSDNKGAGGGVRYTRTVATADVDGTNSDVSFSNVTFTDANVRYWDDAFGRDGLISVYAVAVPNASASLTNNGTTLEGLLTKGDVTVAWGSNSTNTITWQVTTDAQTKDATTATAPTKTIDKEDLVYSNNIQADATLGKDGVYRWNYTSNKYFPEPTGKDGDHKDGRMLFFQDGMTDSDAATTASNSNPGHFDKGHLKFKHALSRITVHISQGEGGGAFNFATGTNITLLKMYVKGTLDIKTGKWTINKTAGSTNDNVKDIVKMAKTTSETTAAGTYTAQMLPEYEFVDGSETNVMQFTIDNNTYYITQDALFDALTYDKDGDGVYDESDGDGMLVGTTGKVIMEQGKNYVFKIKINKRRIENITATLADWVDVVAAEESINNTHVKFTFSENTGTACTDFRFYRLAEDLGAIYTDNSYTASNYSGDYKTEGAATLTEMTGDNAGKYATNWFYENNCTAYHFRTLNALAADENGTSDTDKSENVANTTPPAKSYFTMKADGSVKDYHWGAPMVKDGTNNASLEYTESNGFGNNLHKGITSTLSDIKITELHMMSDLQIVLKTTTDSKKVVLSGATVTLTKLKTSATVDMGTGLITPATAVTATLSTTAPSNTDYWKTENVETKPFTCSVIPQTLVRKNGTSDPTDDDYVGITITTSDNNQYYVVKRLSEILATSVTDDRSQTKDEPIEFWYPGHRYIYTFTITKTGIENITCVVADWVDVTAGNQDLNLES